jgi:hypothetical protein
MSPQDKSQRSVEVVSGRAVFHVIDQGSIGGRLTLSVGVVDVLEGGRADGILIERAALDVLIDSVAVEVVIGYGLIDTVPNDYIMEGRIVCGIAASSVITGRLVNEVIVDSAWRSGVLESVLVRSIIVRKSRKNSIRTRSIVGCGLVDRILMTETMARLRRFQVVDQLVSARKSISCNASWASVDVT